MSLLILLVAIVVSVLVFTGLVQVLKATISTAILITAIVLIASLLFGIGPGQIWHQVTQLFHPLWQGISGGR